MNYGSDIIVLAAIHSNIYYVQMHIDTFKLYNILWILTFVAFDSIT